MDLDVLERTVIYTSYGSQYSAECPYCEIIRHFTSYEDTVAWGRNHKSEKVHREQVLKAVDRRC